MQDQTKKSQDSQKESCRVVNSSRDKDEKELYLKDTIQTFIYEKQALEFKLLHNIAQLSTKNVYLTTVLKQLSSREFQSIDQQTNLSKDIIKACLQLQDDLASLDVLEKKTQILKFQAQQLQQYFQDQPTPQAKHNP